jgi:hypothetical protein
MDQRERRIGDLWRQTDGRPAMDGQQDATYAMLRNR